MMGDSGQFGRIAFHLSNKIIEQISRYVICLIVSKTKLLLQIINNKPMEKDQEEQRPNYLHIYPFRFVQPYPHVYTTYAKQRWIGKELLATLVKEFKAYPPEYYEHAIINGKIKINNKQVQCNYVLKNGDQIIHSSIRTEPPILDLPLEIVSESQEFVIVNKPPSIIVHTGGGHHYNTVESLLKYQLGYKNLHVLHRLDKCTSGLLIFAKSKANVILFHEESEKEIMKKMYFARVDGDVKWEQKTLQAYIECISHKDGVYKVIGQLQGKQQLPNPNPNPILNKEKEQQQEVVPIRDPQIKQEKQQSEVNIKKLKKKQVSAKKLSNVDIKQSKTIFKKIWFDQQTNSSLLECYPVTGRTHQIRVHLQYLGHPILNDVAYGGRFVGNGIIKFIEGKHSTLDEGPSKRLKHSEQLNIEQWDYTSKPWQIMLHSYHYKFGQNSFTTKLPYWYQRNSIEKWREEK